MLKRIAIVALLPFLFKPAYCQTDAGMRDLFSIIRTSSSTFATDVANVTEGVVIVDADYTIPASTTLTISQQLVPGGGVIKFTNSTSHLVVTGEIVRGNQVIQQLSDRSDRAVIEIENQPVCPISFGLHDAASGVSVAGVSNTDVFNDAVIAACSFGGDNRTGARIEVPAGDWYFDKPISTHDWIWPGQTTADGADRDHQIWGNGKRKSLFKVAADAVRYRGAWANSTAYVKGDVVRSTATGEEFFLLVAGTSSGDASDLENGSDGLQWTRFRGFFNFDDIHNGHVSSLGFDGNRDNMPGAWPVYIHTNAAGSTSDFLHPLLRLSSYNFHASDLNIRESKGTGLLVHQQQQYLLDQLDSEHNAGWGVVFEGCWNVTANGLSSENHKLGEGLGGVLVHESGFEDRDRALGILFNQLYLEQDLEGLRLNGVSGVQARGGIYHRDGTAVVLGPGTRSCSIDCRTIETEIEMELGSFSNELVINQASANLDVTDSSNGRNEIQIVGSSSYRWDPSAGVKGTNVFSDSNPVSLYSTESMVLSNELGAPQTQIHPIALYRSSDGIVHKRVKPNVDTWTSFPILVTSLPVNDYYLYLVTRVDQVADVCVRFRNNNGNLYYSLASDAYDGTSARSTYISIPHNPGELRLSKIQFPSPTTVENVQIEIGMLNGNNANLDVYHCDLSLEPNKRIDYEVGGSEIGHGQHVEFLTADLPPANAFAVGTRVWNKTTKTYQYSDETNWVE